MRTRVLRSYLDPSSGLFTRRVGCRLGGRVVRVVAPGSGVAVRDRLGVRGSRREFILARATDDPAHVRAQLGQLRRYLELLLGSTVDDER